MMNEITLTPVSNLYQALDILILEGPAEESSNDMTPGSEGCLMNKEIVGVVGLLRD